MVPARVFKIRMVGDAKFQRSSHFGRDVVTIET